jgi:hypothetical protein
MAPVARLCVENKAPFKLPAELETTVGTQFRGPAGGTPGGCQGMAARSSSPRLLSCIIDTYASRTMMHRTTHAPIHKAPHVIPLPCVIPQCSRRRYPTLETWYGMMSCYALSAHYSMQIEEPA